MNFIQPSLHPDPDVQRLMFLEKVFSLSCLGSVNFPNCLEGEMEKFSTCLLWDVVGCRGSCRPLECVTLKFITCYLRVASLNFFIFWC